MSVFKRLARITGVGVAFFAASTQLQAADCGTGALNSTNRTMTAWKGSSFSGSACREFTGDIATAKATFDCSGGYDSGVRKKSYTPKTVNNFSGQVGGNATISMTTGQVVYGGKFSITPTSGAQLGSGAFECYIVDHHNRSNITSGKTYRKEYSADGATYKVYTNSHSSWSQIWAIRQSSRKSGNISLGTHLSQWKSGIVNGNHYVSAPKISFEVFGTAKGYVSWSSITTNY